MAGVFGQRSYRARFEWGPSGAGEIAPGAAFVVVVDVLSFTTTLGVAAEHGIAVMPYPWRDDSAATVAGQHRAELAVGRTAAGPDEISLSPAALRRVASRRPVERLVLPSPNGSAVSARFARTGTTVIGVSLRNARAASTWVRARLNGQPLAVVAAGERWPDGGLRPAIEDLWGAGAFLDGFDGLSPEAETAVAAYRAVAGRLPEALAASSSGRELAAIGFAADVAVAGEADVSEVVPVFGDGWFRGVMP
ncbi:2-phosphosulfolactate phosphatase [Actinoplanes sp. NPDC020271]|uniref:2-phosphosulfolactate phosphatase n=1 Tax=Actinoplanes sp. NPDC020271 TaxID=3363896 RepID=UPI0037BAC5E0